MDAHTSVAQNLAASELPLAMTAGDERPALMSSAEEFAPFLDIVPSQDGTALFISAGGVGELGGTVFANIGIGPGHDRGGYTMVYSKTARAYVTTAAGFTPEMDDYASMSITTTLGLNTGSVQFNRDYVQASTLRTVSSGDNNLQLALVNTDTFSSDAYIVVVPSCGLPGPPPQGHRLVGSAYSVRASGAWLLSDRPMSLHIVYSEPTLSGADPHALAIFAWDAFHRRWDNLGGWLFYDQRYLSVTTRRFTTYALMVTTTWRDDFYDLSGMEPSQFDNVTWSGGHENQLMLAGRPGSGTAVSKPITPTAHFANWASLTYSCTVDPPTTTLTVDVLTLDGAQVLTDVASGSDLTNLDAGQYPALKLRVHMSSTAAGETPALDVWRLAWEAKEYEVYLPCIVRSG